MTDKPLVYIDASVFVRVLKREAGFEICLAVLEAAERKDIEVLASRLLSVEIGSMKAQNENTREDTDRLAERFLEAVGAHWVELDLMVAREARRVSWEYNLRTLDSVHLATAIYRKATHFMTVDTDFPIGKTADGVWVSLPEIVWDPTLLDGETHRD